MLTEIRKISKRLVRIGRNLESLEGPEFRGKRLRLLRSADKLFDRAEGLAKMISPHNPDRVLKLATIPIRPVRRISIPGKGQFYVRP